MDKLAEWILGCGVAVIGWLVNSKFQTDKEIADIKKDAAARAQQLQDHERLFERVESMFAEMRRNHIDLMKALNGNGAR